MFLIIIVPLITGIFICLHEIHPQLFSAFASCRFFLILGIQLIAYDEIGTRIAHNTLCEQHPVLSLTLLTRLSNKKNIIVRHISFSAVTSLIVGKTPMTATGRASLMVGAFTGGAWLFNCYKDRQAANDRATADRQATETLAAKGRAFQNYQDAKKAHDLKPFYKKRSEPPQWDEDKWEQWKKTLSEDDKRRLNLTQHETTHDNIQDTRTGKIEAIMTSAQNKTGKNPANFDKIDPVKVNGSFTPQKDPKSGKIILDKNGQPIPHLTKGGQYMATLSTSRQLGSDTKHLYDVNKDGQLYVDKHEKMIEENIRKNRKHTLSKKIGGIDEE